MTIRQQGGVFGRNPKFGNVEVDQASIESLSVGDNFSAGDPTGVYLSTSVLNCYWNIQAGFNTKNSVVRFTNNTDANVAGIDYDHLVETMRFFTPSGASVTLNNSGNLAFNSGAGIDFSATSGTGTSELLDDYEEGTWTPEFASAGGSVSDLTKIGVYTKVGNLVMISAAINVDLTSATGDYTVTNLPFVIRDEGNHNGDFGGPVTFFQNNGTTGALTVNGIANSTSLNIYKHGGNTSAKLSSTDTTSTSFRIRFTMTYQAG